MVTQAIVPFRQKDDLDIQTLGRVLSSSGFFADSREAAQAITKVLAGRELGIGPVAAMTSIYIVKGRVTLSANLIAALVKRSGRYDYRVKRLDAEGCAIAFLENGQPIGTAEFTKSDADAAGLWGQAGPWKSYPRNMLFARAMSNGAKWYCPDLFAGPIYTPEELGAAVDGDSGQPMVDLRTGEIIDAEPESAPARGLTPQLRKALADWHEEATRARANGIEPAERDMDTATADELMESATRLLKLRGAAERAGWQTLIHDALELGIDPALLPESCTPRLLRESVEALGVAVARAQKARAEAGEEGPAPAALNAFEGGEVGEEEAI